MREAFLSYRFNDAALCAYECFWNDFCDWYVEATKLSTKSGDEAEKDRATTVLLDVLTEYLRLLHPLLPFVTEEIYQKLPGVNGTLLINSRYPQYKQELYAQEQEKNFTALQSLVGMVRTLRSECGITPEKKLKVLIRADAALEKPLGENEALIKLLAGIDDLTIESISGEKNDARPHGSIGMAGAGFEVFVFIAQAVDTQALKNKFSNDLERDRKYIETLRAKLANEQFVKNAPQELVDEQKLKLEETIGRTEKIANYLKDL
jgi:valyl-tRNA synthetase